MTMMIASRPIIILLSQVFFCLVLLLLRIWRNISLRIQVVLSLSLLLLLLLLLLVLVLKLKSCHATAMQVSGERIYSSYSFLKLTLDGSDHAVCVVGLFRPVAGIAGSNPARGMDVCLCVYILCCPVSVEAFETS
jgi:hypothetical protein